MTVRQRKHAARHLVKAITSSPWAILPSKLDELAPAVELWAAGDRRSARDVRRAIAGRESLSARLSAQVELSPEQPVDGNGRPAGYLLTKGGVALVLLDGLIAPKMNLMMRISGGTSSQQFAAAVRQAAADERVKRILAVSDSPGGVAMGLSEAQQALREARSKKPVWAIAWPLMASAAYHICAGAETIVAPPDAVVGSIGTVSVHLETSKADAEAGLKYTVFTAGRYKWAANPYEPLSADGKAVIDEEVAAFYANFVGSVAECRGLKPADVEANYGQGKTFLGQKAKEAGLVDRVAFLHEILGELEAVPPPPQNGFPLPSPNSQLPTQEEESPMDPRIMQALQAAGLIAANDDKRCAEAVLTAFYRVRGDDAPDAKSEEGVKQILADLADEPAPTKAAVPAAPPAQPAALQPKLDSAAIQAEVAKATAAENYRQRQIRARGEILGVEPSAIEAACDDPAVSLEQFLDTATKQLVEKKQPVGQIEPGPQSADKFNGLCVDALSIRRGIKCEKPAQGAAEMSRAPLIEFAKRSLDLAGSRGLYDANTIAEHALRAGGMGIEDVHGGAVGATAPIHSPGSFPGLLSALVNKSLDSAASDRYAETTFQDWTVRVDDVPDFKPKTIWGVGEFGELPEHKDADEFEQSTMASEGSFIQVDAYGDEVQFTPMMLVNDDLGAFLDSVADKRNAHDATLNRLCVNILTSNAALWHDGVALFHANHGNLVTAGYSPDQTQLAAHRLLYRNQKGISAKRYLNYTVAHVLVPEDLETATETLLRVGLMVQPAQTSNVELFRGRVGYSVDPMLGDASAAIWYSFAPVRRARAIIHCYQAGYREMRVRRYMNPKTNCVHFQCEGRFGAAARNYRGVVRDNGSGR